MHSCRGLRTQLQNSTLSLCALSCGASTYAMTREHLEPLTQNHSSCFFPLESSKAPFLYNPMVCRPWVHLYSWHYTKWGWTTLWPLRALRPQNAGTFNLYYKVWGFYPKTWVFSPKTSSWGNTFPTGPKHKHGDSPSSHSMGVEILAQIPPVSTCTTNISLLYCATACFISLTNCSIAGLALSAWSFY